MNDTNGAIEHRGWYHLFYLYSPFQDLPHDTPARWNTKVWGHARSRDLVSWEHRPIALIPPDADMRCISGSTLIRGDGTPAVFYTYTAIGSGPGDQYAALADDGLDRFDPVATNPALRHDRHDGPRFEPNWRDPFVFGFEGRVFMILGAILDGEPVIPIYEVADDSLLSWSYRGIFFRLPDSDIGFFECPKFFRLEDRWVLVVSPLGPVRYFSGTFDPERLVFEHRCEGLIDHSPRFYAAENLERSAGPPVLLGWIPGWDLEDNLGKGWNGVASLPRELSLSPAGEVLQTPLSELDRLRGEHHRQRDLQLDDGERFLSGFKGDACEIRMRFENRTATEFGLRLRLDGVEAEAFELRYDGAVVRLGEVEVPVPPGPDGSLELHPFLDRCVLEVFAGSGRACLTHLIRSAVGATRISAFAAGGSCRVPELDLWELHPV